MNELIKELRELALLCCSEDGEGAWWQKKILEILSRHEAEQVDGKPTEPLDPPLVMYPWNNEESEEWADVIMLREDAIKKYHLAKGATCKEQLFKDFCEAQEKYCKEWLRIYDHKSLFELAKKKGRKIAEGMFEIDVLYPDEGVYHTFFGPTYAAAEAKARQYLEALPDVKGGVI